ncbi:alanine--tRNA ligase [Candidatus Poriferisodalis sp.]|uniref:alanine--tRNA ligase n=1 Tax=Candidatus Poriferisodalis sp. TaxID=3101277 RepID=UPI003B0290E2
MRAGELREAFSSFWAERGHEVRASASLIPHEPSLLFTVAGMVPFMPYFLGTEVPPTRRMVTIQKCVRAGGKHNDLDDIGRTNRHFTFFEMMGNFSFGDYFKAEAIPWAWEFVTEVLGLDADKLWVTVHFSDDEAAEIWQTKVGVPAERIQRLDKDNWWAAGDVGPCGPCSEIFYDLGPDHGPGGGPAHGGEDRFVEIWNLVFMQFAADGTGELTPLEAPGIDTGAGLERILAVLQGVPAAWDIDLFAPLLAEAERICGKTYGADPETDVSMRIFADHARATAMLISDGVFPSNEDRGHVLRRIIRRAVRHAWVLGVTDVVMPRLTEIVVDVMGDHYTDLVANRQFIAEVVAREEERFRATLAAGQKILDEELRKVQEQLDSAGQSSPARRRQPPRPAPGGETLQGAPIAASHSGPQRRVLQSSKEAAPRPLTLPGEVAFRLHDTFGFPVEVTEEILAERSFRIDRDGFEAAMKEQRERARADRTGGPTFADERYRELLAQFGPTDFVRDSPTVADARVLAVFEMTSPDGSADGAVESAMEGAAEGEGLVEVFLDRTPFYAESGGQIGDIGTITGPQGTIEVLDCTYALADLHRHIGRISGEVESGTMVSAEIDDERRAAIRRNHTGTHILHWALREVLGDHVKQAGSLVAPDRLRFDFSHYEGVSPAQLREIERVANAEIIANGRCRHYETSMSHAQSIGAIAFFGDKYGDVVRVLEAGPHSVELCGGTHVAALGDIGHLRVISESSIGSNMRRIEAVTGLATVDRLADAEDTLSSLAEMLNSQPDEISAAVQRRLDETKELRRQVRDLQRALSSGRADELVASAVDGVVIADLGDLERDALRDLTVSVRDRDGIRAVVLASAPPGGGVALVAAVDPAGTLSAGALLADAARIVGGGFGAKGDPPLVVAGGRNPDGISDALTQARVAALGN